MQTGTETHSRRISSMLYYIFFFNSCFNHVRNRKRPIPRLYSLRLRFKIGMASSLSLALIGTSLLYRQADYIFFCSGSMPIIFGRDPGEFLGVSIRSFQNNPHFSLMNSLSLEISQESFIVGTLCLPLSWSFPSSRHFINSRIFTFYFRYVFLPFLSITPINYDSFKILQYYLSTISLESSTYFFMFTQFLCFILK